MSCLSPRVIRATWKGAKPSQVMSVPCGKCVGCLRDKQNAWIYRLQRENYYHKYGYFVTLTYDEKNVTLKVSGKDEFFRYKDWLFTDLRDVDFSLYPKELTNYFKRLRKMVSEPLLYFACGEYGDQFNRPHYHFLLWYDGDCPEGVQYSIEKAWRFGFVTIDAITDSRISYVTKYYLKGSLEAPPSDDVVPCFSRASHGLGVRGFLDDESYFNTYSDDYMMSCQLTDGTKIPTPRYLRRKFFVNKTFEESDYDWNQYQQNKRERQAFQRYCQDYVIRSGESDIEKITSSYIQDKDPERIRTNLDNIRKRRKGL